MKICKECHQEKPIESFGLSSSGYRINTCKQCKLEAKRKWRADNPNVKVRESIQRKAYAHKVASSDQETYRVNRTKELLPFYGLPLLEGEQIEQCNSCNQIKPIGGFAKAKGRLSGYTTTCRQCIQLADCFTKERVVPVRQSCGCCEQMLPSDAFRKRPSSSTGLHYVCKQCEAILKKRYASYNKVRRFGEMMEIWRANTRKLAVEVGLGFVPDFDYKRCIDCEEIKLLEDFHRHTRAHDGYQSVCKECRSKTNMSTLTGLQRFCHSEVEKALQKNTLVKPSACECGKVTNELDAHHDNYMKPLDVRWLCKPCHSVHHMVYKFKSIVVPRGTSADALIPAKFPKVVDYHKFYSDANEERYVIQYRE